MGAVIEEAHREEALREVVHREEAHIEERALIAIQVNIHVAVQADVPPTEHPTTLNDKIFPKPLISKRSLSNYASTKLTRT